MHGWIGTGMFSTGAMLARMTRRTVATNSSETCARRAATVRPEALLGLCAGRGRCRRREESITLRIWITCAPAPPGRTPTRTAHKDGGPVHMMWLGRVSVRRGASQFTLRSSSRAASPHSPLASRHRRFYGCRARTGFNARVPTSKLAQKTSGGAHLVPTPCPTTRAARARLPAPRSAGRPDSGGNAAGDAYAATAARHLNQAALR